jgi:hypothetical protein
MAEFINVSAFRNSMHKKQFPTGTWLEVKGLALPGQLIEIDMEDRITKYNNENLKSTKHFMAIGVPVKRRNNLYKLQQPIGCIFNYLHQIRYFI